MIKSKNIRVASISFLARIVKLLIAPISLLLISKQLNNEELAFYYMFFSLVGMQQLAELGIGHTMKQYIAHDYKVENGNWTEDSKCRIKGYYHLINLWFIGVSLFILFIVGGVGYFYLGLTNSDIIWKGAWIALVCVSALATFFSPMTILLDSMQKQETVQKVNLYSGIVGSIVLWVCLEMNLGLYSIAVSSFSIIVISLFIMISSFFEIKNKLDRVKSSDTFKMVFKKISPLLYRVSVVWGVGFLFWNTFNFVSFSVLDANEAGKVIFCIALAKAGLGISESITQSQSTIYSNLIANKKKSEAVSVFKKYKMISVLLLLSGYSMFFVIWSFFPNFYLFERIPDKYLVVQIFLFHLILLIYMLKNNFVRCFKIEPFVKQSIFMSLSLPILFYFCIKLDLKITFLLCGLLILVILIFNDKIYKKYI